MGVSWRHQRDWPQRERLRRWLGVVLVAGWWASGSTAAGAADFSAAIGEARDRFTPVGQADLDQAHQAVRQRAEAVSRFVRPRTDNGQRWLRYLKWDAFDDQLHRDGQPELDPLAATYRQLNCDEIGLELPRFRRLAVALRRYLDLASFAREEDQAASYGRQLDALQRELEQYALDPSGKLRSTIGRRLDFLTGIGQADALVGAVRREFARPNALLHASAELLRAAADKPIDRHDPVTDVILGTRIRGRGHTTGAVSLQTVPSDDRATIDLVSEGRVVSNNVGRNGPAVIRSTSFTDFDATTTVELTDRQFRMLPPRVRARASSDIHSVRKAGGGLGRRIVASQGMSQAREKQPRANAISADHAEQRIARRVGDEVSDKLRQARQRYEDEYRDPLARRGQLPTDIRFTTTDDALRLSITHAGRHQLGAPADAPPLPTGNDLVLRLHETAINNYASALLAGATLREDDPHDGTQADVTLPDFIQRAWENRRDDSASPQADDENGEDEDFEPWSLQFRASEPISIALAEGRVELTIHVARLISGDDKFNRWDVTGTFVPELHDGRVTLRREGELVVLPTGFDRQRDQLSSSQAAVRRNLTDVLTRRSDEGGGFPQTVEIEPLEPTGEFADAGPLDVGAFDAGQGWLTISWSRR